MLILCFLRMFYYLSTSRRSCEENGGKNKICIFCIAPLSRTMGDFLETRASPGAGAACERSVGVPWELGLEQKVIKYVFFLEPL